MANILAVDDAATMRQVVNFALTDAGHTVAEAAGVDEALARAAKCKFDLVIADLNMPGKNGLELVKALRAMPDFRFAPVIMLTTESSEKSRFAGLMAGAKAWVVKPFRPDQILHAVSKLAPQARGGQKEKS